MSSLDTRLIPPEILTRAVESLFAQAGSDPVEAGLAARQLVGANLTGHDSHGVGMIPAYVDSLLAGELQLNRTPQPVLEAGAITVLDAGLGLGQSAGHAAMRVAIDGARRHGLSLTALRNSHHLGRIGHWAEQACEAGLVSLHFVNVISRPWVAPHGGRAARYTTNPIAIGVPRPGGPPLLLDFATSRIAVGKARVALHTGRPVPPDSLLDAEGRPTQDPAALFGPPMGALLPFGEHKGSGLALMCEILGSALCGGPVMDGTPPRAGIINNMMSLVIDPARLGDLAAQQAAIDRLLAWVKSSPPREPDGQVVVAGEPEQAARAQRALGVPVDGETWRLLEQAAGRLGVAAATWAAWTGT